MGIFFDMRRIFEIGIKLHKCCLEIPELTFVYEILFDGYKFTGSNMELLDDDNNEGASFLVQGKIPLSYYNKIRNEMMKQGNWADITEEVHESRPEKHFLIDIDEDVDDL